MTCKHIVYKNVQISELAIYSVIYANNTVICTVVYCCCILFFGDPKKKKPESCEYWSNILPYGLVSICSYSSCIFKFCRNLQWVCGCRFPVSLPIAHHTFPEHATDAVFYSHLDLKHSTILISSTLLCVQKRILRETERETQINIIMW